jgi:RHS repeat-associated protein
MTAQEAYLYGADGQKLATYALTASAGSTPYLANSATNLAVFFGGKRVGITASGTTTAFIQDRLGSQGKYYPYGEARGTVPQDAVGFATYTQDSATSLDYADQRYYANNFGRFMTPDPYGGSRSPRNPTSWNRYSYVLGDPINGSDPTGLDCTTASNQTGAPSGIDCGGGDGSANTFYGSSYSALPASGSQITVTSGFGNEAAAGETNYVMQTVVPGYLGAYQPPQFQSGQWIPGSNGVSATVSYGAIAPSQDAIISALSVLPPMSFTATVGVPFIPAVPVTAVLSMIGVGLTVSIIPSTGTMFVGPTVALSMPGFNIGGSLTTWTY